MVDRKESHILGTLENKRNLIDELKLHGIDFESVTLTVYKALYDLGDEGLDGFVEVIRHHELKWNHVEHMTLFDTYCNQNDYLSRKVSFL